MRQDFLPLAECITLETLPSVPVAESQALPREGGIYFVLDGQGKVQYIGRTNNLAVRWVSHHRLQQYRQEDGYRIAWLSISNVALLPAIERACIAYFAPADNGAMIPRDSVCDSFKRIQSSIRLTNEAWALVRDRAQELGISVTALIELAIRAYLKKGSPK